MNLTTFQTSFPAFYRARNTIRVQGAPGVGKTDTIDASCADMSVKLSKPFALVTAIVSGVDPVDMRGFIFPSKGTLRFANSDPREVALGKQSVPAVWPSNSTVEVFVDGEKLEDAQSRKHCEQHGIPDAGVLFFDEFSQADTDIQKVASQVMLDRRLGEYTLPDGWMVVAAGNRVEDRAGVVKTLSHTQNRMCDLEIQPDYEAWQRWAFKANIHPLAIGFAKSNAGEVFRTAVPKEQGPYCTPRSLVLCTKNLEAMRTPGMRDIELPDDSVAAEVIQGWLGEGVMPQFISHIRLANDLPDVDDVIKDPSSAKVPERLDARFVMSTSLSAHASNSKKLKPMLTYMERMDVELQVLFVKSVCQRNPQALTVAEFSKWVQKHQKLIQAAHG
jgi:hypothetical protein